MEDAPDTTRIKLDRIRETGTESERVFATALDRLLEAEAQQAQRLAEARGAEAERNRWAWVWRALGSIGLLVVSAIGARAMSLAETAYTDHPRIERTVESISTQLDSTQQDLVDRGIALTARVERVDALSSRIDAIMARVETTIARLDERVTDLERDARRR